jgi:alcohol dehydrogenase class IV
MDYQPVTDFRINGSAARVYAGQDALGNLPAEVKRQRARRAFVLCGRSVAQKTDLIARIRALLGESFAGIYDEVGKDTPLEDITAARDLARECAADLIIAVGGGSVIQGGRVLAILLAEKGAPEELCTQYPEFGNAISPKLMEKKLPIINVLTVATAAQNRGGSPAKKGDYRLEFFDPKTVPVALFWDADALMTAPASMMRNSAASLIWRCAMDMGYERATPLGHHSRKMIFDLTREALPRMLEDPGARIELCIATYLQNRAESDGDTRTKHWVGRVVYAFATSIFNKFGNVGQGEARAALTPVVMRRFGERDPACMCRMAEALGAWKQGDPAGEAHLRAADALRGIFDSLSMPRTLTDIKVPREALPELLENSLRNFNADPKREFIKERDLLREVLQACW